MWKKLGIVLGILFALALLLFWGAAHYFHTLITDEEVLMHDQFPMPDGTKVILCFFAHPDDEIAMAGTLSKIGADPNYRLIGIYLTRGEAGPTAGLVEQSNLAAERTKELQNAAEILGYEELIFLDFPDGKIQETDPSLIKKKIKEMIYQYKPDVLISYDYKVGLYGHPDHRLTGQYTYEVFMEEKNKTAFTPLKHYCCTLGQKMIATAMELSSTFQRNYPKEKEKGLPEPDFAVFIGNSGYPKVNAIAAHRTQKQVFVDVLPLHQFIPAWIYFRIFDREYFTELASKN